MKKLRLLIALLLLTQLGCMNKIPAVAHYQVNATKLCEEKHSPAECKPATGCTHNAYGDCTAETK